VTGSRHDRRDQGKKGWEYVHIAIDDYSRLAYTGWAYGAVYGSSRERTAALEGWLWHYNHHRRHSALGHQPPVSRTNLLGSYT
jgi:transposase InsO family protein